ncbi:hypothetical protein OE88DRAFT_1801026 [Heliocybe sulcata]|uniref:Uncharacterized protein n=1 Tax=Heliocybe sulcata TaxID=5364 RepID=A0A5C3N1F8_9AGAM|nr:hypothetical protein OE88DRAFT_1801026 [Heliocybe sulcata]
MVESRYRFSRLLSEIRVDQPSWKELTTIEEAAFCATVGYAALVRPSCVLSKAAMSFHARRLAKLLDPVDGGVPRAPCGYHKTHQRCQGGRNGCHHQGPHDGHALHIGTRRERWCLFRRCNAHSSATRSGSLDCSSDRRGCCKDR